MKPEVVRRLIEINRQFYQDFGEAFATTRRRVQPGVRQLLSRWKVTDRILDLGCGGGQLARELAEAGHRGGYLGLDFSLPLLQEAARLPLAYSALFLQADLTRPEEWQAQVARAAPFDVITAFAVLHHIPSHALRLRLLQTVRDLLHPQGLFYHSEWQFLNSPRLSRRIQPWETVGLSPAELEEGDYLLDWRHGGRGLRYVHHFSLSELEQLASEAGFEILETFLSDGENHRLGLYQVWRISSKAMA
ncbi:MAG: class I SAM-dependent methyltransferase [Anaerolineales bacterium]